MKKKYCLFLFTIIIFLGFPASGFSQNAPRVLEEGLTHFASGRFSESLDFFRSVISDPKKAQVHGDAYFWLSKTYLAMDNIDDAARNLEYFLINYENNRNYPEGLYQKGRLLFIQKEYEKAIQVLYNFIDQFPDNSFIGNSYYWVGESLFALGHLEEAVKVYRKIIYDFPKSYKIDAARYRVSIIELKYREQELMKFLKWSHEESLKTLEEFQIREKTYEQAIAAYQKKLSEYAEAGTERKIEELTLDVREKEAEVLQLQEQVKQLTGEIDSLSGRNRDLEARITALSDGEGAQEESGQAVSTVVSGDQDKRMRVLMLKEKALELKEYYLDWLKENAEK